MAEVAEEDAQLPETTPLPIEYRFPDQFDTVAIKEKVDELKALV
jgi:hypothetical protein